MNLRAMLEWDVGLRIFYLDLPSAVAGMYAYHAELGACLVVNHKHPPERRRVSMLHQYASMLVDRFKPHIAALARPTRKPASERFADAFALAFLLPATSIRQRFHNIVTSTNDFQVADLRRLAHFYFVSVESMAQRLEQLGLIAKGSWERISGANFAPREAAESGLRPQPINDQLYPERYQFLAVSAYERDEIGETNLAHFLRCDIVTAREIVANTLTSREVVEATGEERDVRLDFQKSLLAAAS
ncbi:MAG TPA: ImmA/IrrE family metallo-endopeptidase [Pirellulales bacterium]|nr:ImmA/IrrE family metallo-endopeptidase [Pirellulales bacterium]